MKPMKTEPKKKTDDAPLADTAKTQTIQALGMMQTPGGYAVFSVELPANHPGITLLSPSVQGVPRGFGQPLAFKRLMIEVARTFLSNPRKQKA